MTHSFPTRRSSDLFSTGERCGEKNIALHAQQLRQVAKFTVCLYQQDGLVDECESLGGLAGSREPLDQGDVERRGEQLVRRCMERLQDRKSTRLNSSH